MQHWPELDWNQWQPTADTLHMWTQIVGKTRLGLTPLREHWWNVPLYLTARGLTTSAMPTRAEMLDIEFDFVSHELHFRHSSGRQLSTPLRPQSVAEFYAEFQRSLAELEVQVNIWPVPVEIQSPVPFAEDSQHASYDADAAHRFWRVLMSVDKVFQEFSSNFVGKVSPVHFFWGSFDLAVTRFSGRPAPPRFTDKIMSEAYSQEVISAGFWPGNGGFGEAAFYCYAAPVPDGLSKTQVRPAAAYYDTKLGEFVLKYRDIRGQQDPAALLREFLDTTYAAAAEAANWDRTSLERHA